MLHLEFLVKLGSNFSNNKLLQSVQKLQDNVRTHLANDVGIEETEEKVSVE